MLVNLSDCCCRECGGQLEITDADDATMTVLCLNPDCGDSYDVETDAFNDGAVIYHLAFVMKRLREEAGE